MASAAFYQAFVELVPEAKNLRKQIAKEFDTAAPAAGRDAGKGINSGILGTVGKLAAPLAAVFAGFKLGSLIADSISSAADLEQSVGAIDAIFKGSSTQMHQWAETAATDVGLTKNEFNELGTLIGAQLKNGGTAMDELAPKTNDLVKLGADLSSMFGGTTADAVGALSSALKGERDPIERYGVSLNQAKIDAEAAALGFTKVGGALSAEANQAATLSLIMKQTADAHGNFAAESDTLAHKQQVLNALWADGKAAIGEQLLPAVSAGAGMLIGILGPAIQGTVSGLGWLNDAFGTVYNAFNGNPPTAAMGAWTGPLTTIGTALSGVKELAGEIGPVLAGVFAPFAEAFKPLAPIVAELIPQLLQLWTAFSPLSLIFAAVQPLLPQLLEAFAGLAGMLAGALGSALTQLLPTITDLSGVLVSLLGGVITTLLPVITQLISIIGPILSTVISAVVPLFSALAGIITQVLSAVLPLLAPILSLIAPLVQLVGAILGPLVQLLAAIITPIVEWAGVLIGMLIPVIQFLVTVLSAIIGTIAEVITWFVNLVTGSEDVGTKLERFFTELPQMILAALGDLGSVLFSAGQDLIQGLIDGIAGMMDFVGDAVGGVMDFIGDFFPHSPAKRGPFSGTGWLRVKEAGLALGDQFGAGLTASEPGFSDALSAGIEMPSVQRFDSSVYGAVAATAGGSGYSGPLVDMRVETVQGQSNAEIAQISMNALNEELRGL